MSDLPKPGSGVIYGTIYNFVANAWQPYNESNRSEIPFWGTPTAYTVRSDFNNFDYINEFNPDVKTTRNLLSLFLLKDPETFARAVSFCIAYRNQVGENMAQKTIYAFDWREEPQYQMQEGKADNLSKILPEINGTNFQTFRDFLKPLGTVMQRGHFKSGRARDPWKAVISLPLVWTMDLAASAKQADDTPWTEQRNKNNLWWWLAYSEKYAHTDLIHTSGVVRDVSQNTLRGGAYAWGEYFNRLGLTEQCTAEEVRQKGHQLLASFDYAITAKTLLLMKEHLQPDLFRKADLEKVGIFCDDVRQVLQYGERLNSYAAHRTLTDAEKTLAGFINHPVIKNWVGHYLEAYSTWDPGKEINGKYKSALSVNHYETNMDNHFTLRKKTGDFVKRYIYQGLNRLTSAGIEPGRLP